MSAKIKIIVSIAAFCLTSQACSIFSSLPGNAGIIKSIDAGRTYRFANAIEGNEAESLIETNVSRLRFNPENPDEVYASSFNHGLFKSVNSGETWSNVLFTLSVFDFVFESRNPKVIYACGIANNRGKIVKTQDGGSTWDVVFTEGSDEKPIRSLVFGAQGELYAVNSAGQMVVSPDAGLTWKKAFNFNTKVNRLEYYDGKLFAVLSSGGIQYSTDFATTFIDITTSLKDDRFIALFRKDPVTNFNQMFITEQGKLFVSTNSGVFVGDVTGNSWTALDLPTSKDELGFYAVTSSPGGETIYLGVSNNIYASQDGGRFWYNYNIQTSGFVNQLLMHPDNKNILYSGLFVP